MKSLYDFIIKLEKPLNETFKTESGLELHAHQDFSVDRLSNRIAKVVCAPLLVDTPVKDGYEVMIEPTILYKQIYQGVRQGYTALINKEDMLFKVKPNMVILYRKDENTAWKGHLENVMLEPIEEQEPIVSTFLEIPKSAIKKYKKQEAKLLYSNEAMEAQGAHDGDTVIINPLGGVNFWLDGKEHWWIRNTDVFCLKTAN